MPHPSATVAVRNYKTFEQVACVALAVILGIAFIITSSLTTTVANAAAPFLTSATHDAIVTCDGISIADLGIFNQDEARQQETWRTSWTAFAQATKDFLDKELRVHPDKPEFPEAGRLLLSIGEVIKSDLPVMKQFNGPLVFQAKLVKINTTTSELMEGQPFKLEFKMVEEGVAGWLVKPTHVYPKANVMEKWRTIPPGSTVTFKSRLSGIGAMGMGGQYFCVVLLTDAEPVEERQ